MLRASRHVPDYLLITEQGATWRAVTKTPLPTWNAELQSGRPSSTRLLRTRWREWRARDLEQLPDNLRGHVLGPVRRGRA